MRIEYIASVLIGLPMEFEIELTKKSKFEEFVQIYSKKFSLSSIKICKHMFKRIESNGSNHEAQLLASHLNEGAKDVNPTLY